MKVFIEWIEPDEGWHSREWKPFDLTRYAPWATCPTRDNAELGLIIHDLRHNAPKNQSLGEIEEEFSEIPEGLFVSGLEFELRNALRDVIAKARFVKNIPFEEVPYVPPPPPPPKPKAKPTKKSSLVEKNTDMDELENVFAMLSKREAMRKS